MAYLVKVLDGKSPHHVKAYLNDAVEHSRFMLTAEPVVRDDGTIDMNKVRLRKAKEYCGQHPGECVTILPRAKAKRRFLEWDDWVEFHEIVNDVLDAMKVSADVSTKPMETVEKGSGGKFWIRKATKRRLRYDWREDYGRNQMVPTRWWNWGTDDQFLP